ncbi:MAG: peptide ABC transporter substrate-binding protein [Candidatus Eremiobacteraeota bacterium]|nr:peptide ABC transporter substrate-binding protein [Candidatus Eremiobacteraeota bacterium]
MVFLLALIITIVAALAPSGEIRFDLAADPSTLNPLFAHADAASVEQQVDRLLFEPFVDIDEQGRAIPQLLETIPSLENGGISHDGKTIVYKLRRGVVWSDGVPVDADDVLFTLAAIMDPRNPVRSRAGYELIERATRLDARTVEIHLRRPWAPAVATFFSYGTSPQYVLPKHLLAGIGGLAEAPFNRRPVGNGPYLFASWRSGERLRFASNPRYWKGAPAVSALNVAIVPDPGTNLILLQSGGVDWNLIAPSQEPVVARNPKLKFRYVALALVAGIVFNTAHPPLDDARVRRALAASIDREAISRKITFGRYPVIETAQPLRSWARDPAVRQPRFDPREADRLLDEAGWRRGPDGRRARDGRRLALVYVQFPESRTGVATATFVQSELRDRGIDLTIKSIANAQLFLPKTGILAAGTFDLAYVPFQMGADPDDSFLFACDGIANYARWCDREVDGLERRAVASPSRLERKRLYGEIERVVARDVPVLFLFNPSYIYAYDARLRGFSPNAFSPTWNAGGWSVTR